jgi:hypothetical protein
MTRWPDRNPPDPKGSRPCNAFTNDKAIRDNEETVRCGIVRLSAGSLNNLAYRLSERGPCRLRGRCLTQTGRTHRRTAPPLHPVVAPPARDRPPRSRGKIGAWQLAATLLWSPTIRAAFLAGTPWLDVFYPGCGTSRAIDLRAVDRHPLASVATMVLGLRCSWCPGSDA